HARNDLHLADRHPPPAPVRRAANLPARKGRLREKRPNAPSGPLLLARVSRQPDFQTTRSLPPSAAPRKIPESTSPHPAPTDPSCALFGCASDSTSARHHRRRSPPPALPGPAPPLHPASVPVPRHMRVEFPFHFGPRASANIERSRAHKRGSRAIARSKRHPDAPAAPPRTAQSSTRIPSSARPPAFSDTKYPERKAPPLLPAGAYSEKSKIVLYEAGRQ